MSDPETCGACGEPASDERPVQTVTLPNGDDAPRCAECYAAVLADETNLSDQQAEIVAAVAMGATKPELRQRFGRGIPYNQLQRIREKAEDAERSLRTTRVLEGVDL